jgi:chromosome partitioning protein
MHYRDVGGEGIVIFTTRPQLVIQDRGIFMRVLAVTSQKGGSGKTTLSGHLAVQAELSGAGPVVLVDTDPQGSLTACFFYAACAEFNMAKIASPLSVPRSFSHIV